MAFTIEQYPVDSTDKIPVITNWTPLIGYMIYQSDIAGLFYYKLVLLVQQVDSAGVVIQDLGQFKQRRNGYSSDVSGDRARAFFDLREIINSQLVNTVFDQNDTGAPFLTIHKLGANEDATFVLSKNGDNSTGNYQILSIKITGSEFYSSTASAVPTSQGSTVTDTLIYTNASLPLLTARNTDGDFVQSDAFNVFQASNVTDKFLTDTESYTVSVGLSSITGYINYVRENDYHTLAFLNDNDFDSDIDRLYIKYYDNTGTLQGGTGYISNTTLNGGMPPNNASVEDEHRILYFGCGPGNLEAQDATSARRPSTAYSDWVYYTIQGTASNGTTAKTALYYFVRQDGSCKGFKVRRLAWRNSLGCYDYFNFKMKSSQKIKVKRNNYNTLIGTYNKSNWRYNDTQRGLTTRDTSATLTETLQTDWVSEQDARLLEKLIYSTNVEIVENTETEFTQGVVITDSSFKIKTTANDKMIKYTINIEYSNPVNTNS